MNRRMKAQTSRLHKGCLDRVYRIARYLAANPDGATIAQISEALGFPYNTVRCTMTHDTFSRHGGYPPWVWKIRAK